MSGRSVQLILDFDGTLTKKDTLHVVAEAGYKRQEANSKSDNLPPWQEIVDAYVSDYESHTAIYSPEESQRKSLRDETVWLDSLQGVEQASADRVNKAGIFDGVTKQDIEYATAEAINHGEVQLRPGWAELILAVYMRSTGSMLSSMEQDMLQVVSVNWSRWLVWSVLWKAMASLEDSNLAKSVKSALTETAIYANELPSILSRINSQTPSLPSPRGEPVPLRTAGDKLKHMRSKLRRPNSRFNPLTIYIGDSTTDLECLAFADIGICMRDRDIRSGQKDLQVTCERIDIDIAHLSEHGPLDISDLTTDKFEDKSAECKRIYYVYDFYEIEQWLSDISVDIT